jgi:hypothetical protein
MNGMPDVPWAFIFFSAWLTDKYDHGGLSLVGAALVAVAILWLALAGLHATRIFHPNTKRSQQ